MSTMTAQDLQHILLGESEAMRALRSLILQVAPTDISVLIVGESGTGKELVARAIHDCSRRMTKPLLFVNCGAIPEGIFESEIFGHEKGSFTGADRQRLGYFEQVNGGTLVLDEIGEMPLTAQVKLLRVLESGEYLRVGSSRPQRVDVRIVAATNVDLALSVSRGDFRQDLYYRLKAVTINVPPLRERKEDIAILSDHFVRSFSERNHFLAPRLTEEARRLLSDQYWAGNIRELRNTIETSLTLRQGNAELDASDIRPHLPSVSTPSLLPMQVNRPVEEMDRELLFRVLLDMRREVSEVRSLLISALAQGEPERRDGESSRLNDVERDQILKVLEGNRGNRRKTARDLGIGERTLYRKLKEYEIH
jgi:DNA-binding NtrC family response regulator